MRPFVALTFPSMLKREKSMMFFGLNADQRSYEGVFLFFGIYIFASLFAATFTAPLYWLIQWWASVSPSETMDWLLGKRMDVFYDRLRWAPIIIGLPWMMKRCGMFSWKNLGLPASKAGVATFGRAFLTGVIMSAIVCVCQYFHYGMHLRQSVDMADIIISSLLGGIILGFLEEIVFRGLIMRSFYTAWGPVTAIILTSLFFAYKHFKVPGRVMDALPNGGYGVANWDVGFLVAYYDTIGICMTFNAVQFFALFMFSAVLALVYIRTKMLWGPIAFHAGSVFFMLSYRKIFERPEGPDSVFFGTGALTNGYMVLILLTAIFAGLLFLWPKKKEEGNG